MPNTPGALMLCPLKGLIKQTFMKSGSLGISRNWAGNDSSVYIHYIEPTRCNILLYPRALKQLLVLDLMSGLFSGRGIVWMVATRG